jgi:hypothetical protein
MEYKLFTNKNELDGTCYFEFLPGKYQNKCWNDNSVFLSEDAVFIFEDLLKKTNESFDHYAFVYYTRNQINMFENELLNRIEEIKENHEITGEHFYKNYYKELNESIDEYKEEITKMLGDLIVWLKSIDENELTVLGI